MDRRRRALLKGAAFAPLGYAIKQNIWMPDMAYAQLGVFAPMTTRTINCKRGDRIGIFAWPSSTDPWENMEGESVKLQVNGHDLIRAVNSWNRPIRVNFLAESDRIEASAMVDEDTAGITDNFCNELVIIRNGSLAFTEQEKALAYRNMTLAGATGLALGGVIPALAALGVAVTGPLGVALGWMAGAFGGMGLVLGKVSYDPIDTNYTQLVDWLTIYRPAPTLPTFYPPESYMLNGTALNALQGAINRMSKIWAYLQAAYISANRAEGARAALNLHWEEQQTLKAREYLKSAAQLMAGTGQLRSRLVTFKNNWLASAIETNPNRDNRNFIKFQQSLMGIFGEHPEIKSEPGPFAQGFMQYVNSLTISSGDRTNLVRLVGGSPRPLAPQGYISVPPGYLAPPYPSSIFPDMLQPMIDSLPGLKQEFLS